MSEKHSFMSAVTPDGKETFLSKYPNTKPPVHLGQSFNTYTGKKMYLQELKGKVHKTP